MKKTLDRVLTVALLFVAVLWLLTIVARTDWAEARSLINAGPGYEGVLRPFIDVAASTIVAVVGVRLVKGTWQWFAVTILERHPGRRNTRVGVPTSHTARRRELTSVGR